METMEGRRQERKAAGRTDRVEGDREGAGGSEIEDTRYHTTYIDAGLYTALQSCAVDADVRLASHDLSDL